ncbi:MAG: TIGR01620 family protein [Methylophaga sp.]|nr:TIGR01620 family protein [Methylophaga sp.]
MSEQDPYFKSKPQQTETPPPLPPETFFTALDGLPASLPDSVEDGFVVDISQPDKSRHRGLKAWFFSFLTVFMVWIGYDGWLLMQQLLTDTPWLAGVFAMLLVILLVLTTQQLWLGWRSRRRMQRVEFLRDAAVQMRHEQSRGRSADWLQQLGKLYADSQHSAALTSVTDQLPDYLHDGEVVEQIDEHFFKQLDQQALQLIQRDSVHSAVLVAVSQLAIVDTLWVIWKTLKMVNQIHLHYGVKLGPIAQWRLNLRVCKVAFLSYSTQAGLTLMAEKTSLGLSGKIAGSVAQGIGVGLYQARIGISAMQQIRPVPFAEGTLPKNRFLSNIAKSCLSKIRGQSAVD